MRMIVGLRGSWRVLFEKLAERCLPAEGRTVGAGVAGPLARALGGGIDPVFVGWVRR